MDLLVKFKCGTVKKVYVTVNKFKEPKEYSMDIFLYARASFNEGILKLYGGEPFEVNELKHIPYMVEALTNKLEIINAEELDGDMLAFGLKI